MSKPFGLTTVSGRRPKPLSAAQRELILFLARLAVGDDPGGDVEQLAWRVVVESGRRELAALTVVGSGGACDE
jgi:hypothetical protein